MQTCQTWFSTRFVTLIKIGISACVCMMTLCVCFKRETLPLMGCGIKRRQCVRASDWWQALTGCSKSTLCGKTTAPPQRSAGTPMPTWCIKVSEHKSFMTKRPHVALWGVKTGISLNYYYAEGKSCVCSAGEIILKQKKKKKKKRRANAAFVLSANLFFFFFNWTCYCCSNQHSASYVAHRAAELPVSTTQSHQWTEQPSGPERRWINEHTYCWQELNTTVAAGWWTARERPGATVRLSLPHSSKRECHCSTYTWALLPKIEELGV